MKESQFQASLIRELKKRLDGCIILKNDANYIQGIPDILILNGKRWAALEVKRSARASHRPNQDYWVARMNDMSFCKFIYPENKEVVLDEIQQALQPARKARVSKSKSTSMVKVRQRETEQVMAHIASCKERKSTSRSSKRVNRSESEATS